MNDDRVPHGRHENWDSPRASSGVFAWEAKDGLLACHGGHPETGKTLLREGGMLSNSGVERGKWRTFMSTRHRVTTCGH